MWQTIKNFYTEFKQAILFLVRFCVTFGILSLLYSYWIGSYGSNPDPVTTSIASQVQGILKLFFKDVTASVHIGEPAVDIFINGQNSISVFEGCNGIAIFNLFFSFLVGYWGGYKRLLVFTLIGFAVIHICNLIRLLLLGWLALTNTQAFHFTHKYLFTIFIYVIVLILWYFWVSKINPAKKTEEGKENEAA